MQREQDDLILESHTEYALAAMTFRQGGEQVAQYQGNSNHDERRLREAFPSWNQLSPDGNGRVLTPPHSEAVIFIFSLIATGNEKIKVDCLPTAVARGILLKAGIEAEQELLINPANTLPANS